MTDHYHSVYYTCDTCDECRHQTPEEAIECLLDESIGPSSDPLDVIRTEGPIGVCRHERTEKEYSVAQVESMMRYHRPDWFEPPVDLMQRKGNGA